MTVCMIGTEFNFYNYNTLHRKTVGCKSTDFLQRNQLKMSQKMAGFSDDLYSWHYKQNKLL